MRSHPARLSRPAAAAALSVALAAGACGPRPGDPAPAPDVAFRDAAAESGLHFRHDNGATGRFLFCEMTGAGAGWLDYDRDGDLDAYLVDGGPLGVDGAPRPVDRLFRNDLRRDDRGRPAPRFVDVTGAAGLRADGYGMGVAVGDVDDDGAPDLYLANFGSNQLWRNRGDGTFEDVTAASGVDDPRWSTGAAFLDEDGDGALDLFVVDYVDYRLATHKPCLTATGAPDYCGPQSYSPVGDRLFRNRGDGSFVDVSAAAGIAGEAASGLGAVTGDFDGDGAIDLYVANDLMRNHLWLRGADGRREERALVAGCAVGEDGRAQASMGVVAGDVDGDGDEDLFMTHLVDDTNTLYLNDGDGTFRDASAASRLAAPSRAATGFGTALLDFDADGRLDVLAVNGAVRVIERLRTAGDPSPLDQPDQLFRNLGGGRFADATARAPVLAEPAVGRGLAVGDVDGDGDPDALVTNNGGTARLLLATADPAGGWIAVDARRRPAGGPAHGARVAVEDGTGRRLISRVRPDGSYASSRDPRLLFGLGAPRSGLTLTVDWPGGETRRYRDLASGRLYVVAHGGTQGDPAP